MEIHKAVRDLDVAAYEGFKDTEAFAFKRNVFFVPTNDRQRGTCLTNVQIGTARRFAPFPCGCPCAGSDVAENFFVSVFNSHNGIELVSRDLASFHGAEYIVEKGW